jgi:hypothetical protein
MIQLFHRVTAIVPDAPPAEGQDAIREKAGRCYPVILVTIRRSGKTECLDSA